MNRSVRKSLSLLLAMLLCLVSCLSLSVNAESPENDSDEGKMNLDVVFVLDASGSMLSSDPSRIAIDTFNLFTDLCDETCGVGYSVYTHKLKASNPIVSLGDKKNLKTLRKNISNIKYDPSGSTDIALGLTKAMNIHSENKNTDSKRKKAVILLSDGNTYLKKSSRTLEEAQKEMDSTLNTLNDRNIPVYSIGLNCDGTLDKTELEKISDTTNGKTYETTTSDDLISIISDIFSDIYRLNGTKCEIQEGNVTINVKDNSVFYVNVIIQTKLSKEELSPVLTSPDGKKVSLENNNNIKLTSTGSYTLIKMIYPDSGKWNLHLNKANSDNCTVTQLDFYSIYIKQQINKTAVIGETVKIESSLNDINGVVDDYDLLKTIEMTAIVNYPDGDKEIPLIRKSDGVYTGEFTVDSEGEYTVKTKATSKTFEKESNATTITVKLTADEQLTSDSSNTDNSGMSATMLIVIGVVIISVLIIVVIFTVLNILKHRQTEYFDEPPAPQPPKPQPQPIKNVTPAPKPKDPDYVDIPLVEHGSLESLIKKGAEDPFNTKLDEYKADPNLEKLIKKGADDPFNTKLDEYKSDPNLEKLIKSGESGLQDNAQNNADFNAQNEFNVNNTAQPSDKVNLNKNTNNNP